MSKFIGMARYHLISKDTQAQITATGFNVTLTPEGEEKRAIKQRMEY